MSELELIQSLTVIQKGGDAPYYGWYISGGDYILNLGKMKKAIVVQAIFGKPYFTVAIRSYFPFPQEMYDKHFDTREEAIKESSEYVANWLGESIKNLGL